MSTYNPEPSLAATPYPTFGPETPPGPADWQQGDMAQAQPVPEPMPTAQTSFPKTTNNLESMSADQLTRFMADPRFEHMPPIVQQMVAEQFKRKSAPVDPMDALNVEKTQLEIERMRNPPPEKPTDDMREFDLAIKNPAFRQYMLEMKRAGSSSINLGGGSDKQIFDTMNESAISAQQATKGLLGIREARKALPGAILGAGADFRLGLQKIGALMGVADTNAIADTETFRAAIAPQVAAMLKSTVGSTQISNADREFAEKASGGSIKLDGASIAKLLDIMERGSSDTVQRHLKRLDAVYPDTGDFQRERALFGVEALPPLAPEAPAQTGPVQIQSVDDYNKLPPGTQYIGPDGQLRIKR
jgi:hypothetical protein